MHVFLTGATGFIGRNLLKGFLNAGFRVTAVVRPESANENVLPPERKRLQYIFGYFYDPLFLETLEEQFDVIVHAAAIRGAGKAKAKNYRLVNIEGTRVLTEFALKSGISRFLYLSTVGVLGTIPQNLPARANDPARPDNLYHQTKWEAEEIIRKVPQHALNTIILRPTITYGAYDNGFIPRLTQLVKQKRMVLPSKEVKIHLLSVDSLARLVTQIIAIDFFNHKTYLIADREPISLRALAEAIAQITDGKYYLWPEKFFEIAEKLFALLGRSDLQTSLQLISKSWYYDITPITKEFIFEPVDTLTKIMGVIESQIKSEDN